MVLLCISRQSISTAGTDDDEDEQFTTSVSTSRLSCNEINEGSAQPHDRYYFVQSLSGHC